MKLNTRIDISTEKVGMLETNFRLFNIAQGSSFDYDLRFDQKHLFHFFFLQDNIHQVDFQGSARNIAVRWT